MNKNTEHFQHLHDLAKQIVDDPHSADADTAAALKSATLKLVTQYDDPTHALKTLYLGDSELSSLLRQAVAIVSKDGADDDDEIIEKARSAHGGLHGLGASVTEHLLDRLSRLRREHGFEKTAKDHSMDIEKLKADRTENLLAIGKSGGAVAMAKILVADNDAHGIDESTYTQILTEHATKLFPDRTPFGAFDKLFSDPGPDGVTLRKGHAVVRANSFEANDDTESSEAYAQLVDKAEKMRESSSGLSADQAFAKVFTDPANAGLAAKAHRRPSATTSYEFPR
jgi:hypothetical protein